MWHLKMQTYIFEKIGRTSIDQSKFRYIMWNKTGDFENRKKAEASLLGLLQLDGVDEFAAGVALVTSRIVETAQIADA